MVKQKFWKKVMCITLTAALQLSLLTGCKSMEEENSDSRTAQEVQVSTQAGDVQTDDVLIGNDDMIEAAWEGETVMENGAACDAQYISDGYYESGYNNGGDTREYDYEEENRFYSAEKTPYSTFAADADTASYSNIRSYLKSGNTEVPVSAVRIEEMVNYFHYDYAEPKEGEPFSVNMEIGNCPWEEAHYLVQIGLQTEAIDMEHAKPNNFVFLIDTSGSMASYNKLPLVQTAFTKLLENLGENDTISIVTYAGSDEILMQGVHGNETSRITAGLDSMTASGSTNGSAGINTAYEVAEQYFIKGGNNRVILATDGDLNVGVTDEGGLIQLIEEKRESGVYLSVLGFGTDNLKDNKLEALADYGNGNYAFIDSVYEAKRVLITEMGATLNTVAKDVKLQAEFDSDYISEYRLIGYENRTLAAEDFEDDTVDGGEIGAGHRVTALYEVVLTEKGKQALQKKKASLLQLSVRYKEPEEAKSRLLTYELTSDLYRKESSDNMKWASAAAGFGMLLRNSRYSGKLDYDMVLSLAQDTDYKDDPLKEEFILLVEIAKGDIEICY